MVEGTASGVEVAISPAPFMVRSPGMLWRGSFNAMMKADDEDDSSQGPNPKEKEMNPTGVGLPRAKAGAIRTIPNGPSPPTRTGSVAAARPVWLAAAIAR